MGLSDVFWHGHYGKYDCSEDFSVFEQNKTIRRTGLYRFEHLICANLSSLAFKAVSCIKIVQYDMDWKIY